MESEEAEAKPISGAKKRLILKVVAALAIVVILIVIFISSAPADPYDTVDKVMTDPSRYIDKHVEVRGKVDAWSSSQSTFSLTGDSEAIVVVYDVIPGSFANGKDVVVKGLFVSNGGIYQIDANEIIVGCSSRY